MNEAINAVFTKTNMIYLAAGLLKTLQVAAIAILFSIPIGMVLALARSYSKGIAGKLAGIYIELFRNTPNLLWVFVCFIAAPFGSDRARCASAYVLFTSAMMAEIFRGGLNSIPAGQFEAAESQGFSFIGTIWSIIIPQCMRNTIPTMMSQIVTVIKDTSFMAQVAVAELLYNTKNLMATLYVYSGHPITTAEVIMLFAAAAAVYFAINFTIAAAARAYQAKMAKDTGKR